MRDFEVVVVRSGTAAVVQVCGELDMETGPRLSGALLSLADDGVTDIVADLGEMEFIDSSGLRALVVGLKRLREAGGKLRLRSPRPPTSRVLEITGLSFLLEAAEGTGIPGETNEFPTVDLSPRAGQATETVFRSATLGWL